MLHNIRKDAFVINDTLINTLMYESILSTITKSGLHIKVEEFKT